MTWREIAAFGGGDAVPTAGGKRGKGHRMVPFPPLDSPKPSFEPLSEAFAAKRGLRRLGSGRLSACGTLLCPEFTLRKPPRITVRGQTVQGGGVPLRKAPLPSSVDPWSTKRPCGPLAFRRATEGSRVLRRVWGRQEGAREPYGALAPFCLRRETPAISPPGDPGNPPAVGTALPSPPGDPGKAAQSYNFVTLQRLSVTQRTDRAPAVPARTYRSRGGTRPP